MAVIEANLARFWRLYGATVPDAERVGPDGVIAYAGPSGFGLLNPVCRVRLGSEAADAAIAELVGLAAARGSDQWWWGGPGDEPADLGSRLVAAGLTEQAPSPGMAIELAGWSAPDASEGLEIVDVGPAQHADYMRVFLAAFALPEDTHAQLDGALAAMAAAGGSPVRNFLGVLDGVPVACATALLADGVVGVWNVGTLEAARGRGVGTALTAAAMRVGADQGAATAILIATPLGEPVYRSMGFRTVCEMPMWTRLS